MDIKNIKINLPWKKIFKIFGNILFVLVIIVAVLMILSKFSIGGLRVLTVKSGSMSPTIFTGSVAFVSPVKDYKIGDIITFRAQGEKELFTHRIAEVDQSTDQTYYRTKGDANDASDSYKVPQNGVVGKVFFSIPLLGYVIEFAKTPVGLILLIVIPATVIIYEEIRKIKNEWKKVKWEKEKKDKLAKENPAVVSIVSEQPTSPAKRKIWTALTKHRKIFAKATLENNKIKPINTEKLVKK